MVILMAFTLKYHAIFMVWHNLIKILQQTLMTLIKVLSLNGILMTNQCILMVYACSSDVPYC